MSFGSKEAPKAPVVVERFLKQLVITYKAVLLYPAASNIPQENAAQTVKVLHELLEGTPEVRLSVAKSTVFYEGIPVFPGQPAFEGFARELYNRRVADVRFHSGTRADHVARFLEVLKHTPEELAASGGIPGQLWEMGVDSITVTEASATIVDEDLLGDAEGEDGESWPPTPMRIQEIIANAYGDSPRDKRLLVRVVNDPEAVASYIHGTIAQRGGTGGEGGVLTRFMELVHLAAEQSQEVQAELFKSLAEAVGQLPEDERRELIAERLLPEARTDDSLAAVLRRLDIDEVCHLLVQGLTEDDISNDGLARAVRNLAMISLAERDEVITAAGAAMRQAGHDESVISDVVEASAPSFLTVSGEQQPMPDQEEPESVLQLLDLAPTTVAERFEDDASFVAMQEESRHGVSDGDVARTLVSIISVDATGDSFPSLMTLVESSVELLIERGDFDVAADTAESLEEAARTPGLPDDRVSRIRSALLGMASVDHMRSVSKAMRMYDSGSPEHAACNRLLTTLGSEAIDPLLELVADEPDMASRKQLVDLVSQMATAFIGELSARVTDPRWYVVRNVVMILGKTHDPEILPALGRTLRHSDARVRRETIRALASVPDRLASEMLIAALSDSDAQNVQLAARYLGTTNAKGAVQALLEVARGEGSGNRETAARVEAIEALGQIGSPEVIPALEQLTERRGIRRARTREISSAAQSAVVFIKNGGVTP